MARAASPSASTVWTAELEPENIASLGMVRQPTTRVRVSEQKTEFPCRGRKVDVVQLQYAACVTGEGESDPYRVASLGDLEGRKLVGAEVETPAAKRPVGEAEGRVLLVTWLEHRSGRGVDRIRLEHMG